MMERILRNWKTTVIGLVILAVCFVLVFVGKATLTEVGVFICGGFFVLFSKDSLLRKANLLVLPWIVPLLVGCRPYQSFTDRAETIERDTVRTADTVFVRLVVPGDTVVKYRERISYDTVLVERLRDGRFCVEPWDTCTKYAYARAGITDNVPWLELRQREIHVDTAVYVERIRVLERRLREVQSRVVKEKPFFESVWFWIALVLVLLMIRRNV